MVARLRNGFDYGKGSVEVGGINIELSLRKSSRFCPIPYRRVVGLYLIGTGRESVRDQNGNLTLKTIFALPRNVRVLGIFFNVGVLYGRNSLAGREIDQVLFKGKTPFLSKGKMEYGYFSA